MRWPRFSSSLVALMLFALPASSTYELHDYGFGAGGSGVSDSGTYSLSGVAGEISGEQLSGTAYDLGPGLQFARQANTPAAPTFTNPASHYNRLHYVLDTGDNPSDAVFAIAISADSFSTTQYIQADNTVGSSPVYQTYAAWGGGSGADVIGLLPSTTYSVKARAVHTKYNESAWSAVATAATTAPTLSYDLDVHATDTETSPPYVVAFGTLNLGSVTTATQKVWVDVSTNAEEGAFVYVYANDTGLLSSTAGHTITSVSGDLTSVSEGFGLQSNSTTQSAGGPLTAQSPYNSGSEIVGIVDTDTRTIFTSSNSPITGGRGSLLVKAKAATTTPAAGDYASILTMIASATF
jgi:hypothetical protein